MGQTGQGFENSLEQSVTKELERNYGNAPGGVSASGKRLTIMD